MKKVFIFILIPFLISCAGYYKQATYVSSKTNIGMSISQFKSIAGRKASLEAMEAGYTVYRLNDYDYNGRVTDTKFYYFNSNQKLAKVDGGEFKQARYQVEVINH